jgi:hypothetical protein
MNWGWDTPNCSIKVLQIARAFDHDRYSHEHLFVRLPASPRRHDSSA